MSLKKKIIVSFCGAAVLFSNLTAFAGLVDKVEVAGDTLTLSGTAPSGGVVGVYTMTDGEKAYGDVESGEADFSDIEFIVPDSDGSWTFEESFDDNGKSVYVKASNGESKLLRVKDYISDVFECQIFISPDGNDEADGTYLSPLKTISAAKGAVQNIKKSAGYNGGNIAVNFLPGVYRVGRTNLGAADSGTAEGKIVWRAYEGEVTLKNSKELDAGDLRPVSDESILRRLPVSAADKVMELDLGEYLSDTDYVGYGFINNMGAANYGIRGMTRLFLNDKPQTVSRWPNTGYKDLLLRDGESSVGANGAEGSDIVLKFDDANVLRWTGADDMVIRGYFPVGFHGNSYNVRSIDAENRLMTLKNDYSTGIMLDDSFNGKRRWYAENLLEEIDLPGEYYIDEDAKKLYYYPAYELSDEDTLELVAGTSGDNMFTINGAEHISFEGLNFCQTTYKAISVTNSSDIVIDGCDFGYTRSNAVQVNSGSRNVSVKNSVFYYTAGSAVHAALSLTDEEIAAYENTGIVVENNHIYRAGENSQYASPAIHTDGVMDVVKNNTIHFAPINGIEFASPGGKFLNNEIYRAVYDGTDSGAMHIGGDWRRYGVSIEYNYIHDLGVEDYADGSSSWPVAGIYWDEVHSGTEQNNNIIVNDFTGASKGVFMNGGRDHTAKGNVIVGAKEAFTNTNTHSSYYLGYGEDLHPSHSGLNATYENFLKFYEVAKSGNSPYYALYGDKMEELKSDIENNGRFDAKNLDFTENVLVDCAEESVLGKDIKGDGTLYGSLIGKTDARKYTYNSETGTYEWTPITIDNSETVSVDNYKAGEGVTRADIFVDPENGDYRVTESGKTALGIEGEFKLDESFDLQTIGSSDTVTLGDSFKKLYPRSGEEIASASTVELSWEPALFVDEYEYFVYDESGKTVAQGSTMYTTAKVTGLSQNTKYSWNVRAKYCSAVAKVQNKGLTVWESVGGAEEFTTSASDVTVLNVSASADNGTVYYTLVNNSGRELSAKLILAKYEGSELVWVKTADLTVGEGETDGKTADCEISDKSGVKAFVWSDDGLIKPLSHDKTYLH